MKLPHFPRWVTGLSALGTGVGLIVLYKGQAPTHEGDERLEGRTVIVTGANSGIGKETAKELARRGGRILMACRDMEKCAAARDEICEATLNRNVHCRQMDLGSMTSIRRFAEEINETEARLDILINNAGVMACPRMATEDGFELQLAVNHLGPFLLTHLLLDKLKASAPSRIVNVATPAHRRGRINMKDFNGLENYNAQESFYHSRLASIMCTQELAKRLQGTNVTVYSANPGITRTAIGRHLGSEKSDVARTILNPLWWLVMRTPPQGAQMSVYCALKPGIEEHSGRYFEDCRLSFSSPESHNEEKTQFVWKTSEKWTGLAS